MGKFFLSSARNNKNGFALLELLLASAIMVVFGIFILAGYGKFKDRISVMRTAEEVAVIIHQAQAYALGVRESSQGSGFYPGYGVHFDRSVTNSFTLFADLNKNNTYDGSSENVEVFKIQTDDRLSFCANVGASPVCNLSVADLSFLRPNPTVTIRGVRYGSPHIYPDIRITLTSPRGLTRNVTILQSGQISVQ